MNHYGLLDHEQKAKWKLMAKESYEEEDDKGTQLATRTYGDVNFDHFMNRNEKIAMFKRKKDLEQQLDMLRDYKDEDTRRRYYTMMLTHSVVRSFE